MQRMRTDTNSICSNQMTKIKLKIKSSDMHSNTINEWSSSKRCEIPCKRLFDRDIAAAMPFFCAVVSIIYLCGPVLISHYFISSFVHIILQLFFVSFFFNFLPMLFHILMDFYCYLHCALNSKSKLRMWDTQKIVIIIWRNVYWIDFELQFIRRCIWFFFRLF